MRKEITAKFHSRCSACGSDIHPGDSITYDPAVKYSSRHKTCPSTIIHSKEPLNSPGRGALQGRGRSDFFVGDRTDIVRCFIEGHKPAAQVPAETIHDRGTKRDPQDRYITCVGMGAHYVSQDEADDFDLIGLDGSFSAHWSVQYCYRLATDEEAATVKAAEAEKQRQAEEAERAAREQSAQIAAQLTAVHEQVIGLFPLGIRTLTREEHEGAWAAIMSAQGYKWEKDHLGREVTPAELVLSNVEIDKSHTLGKAIVSALGQNWGRLPAMPGNEQGTYGWTRIYRWRDRQIAYFENRDYDSGGPSLQGISVTPEDASLIADMAQRSAIKGYRFHPDLYAAMVALDADGKLSEYGRWSYFGGTPSPCYDLPESERACTMGAYGHNNNRTSGEMRAELIERFKKIEDPRAVAARPILTDPNSVTEIR